MTQYILGLLKTNQTRKPKPKNLQSKAIFHVIEPKYSRFPFAYTDNFSYQFRYGSRLLEFQIPNNLLRFTSFKL